MTTDHISPAGAIQANSPAGAYLQEHGIVPKDFNSYGTRRGNHDVMIRGTFANVRLRNQLAPGTEGGVTRHLPDGQTMPIFGAATRYAKGTLLLGFKAVLATSFDGSTAPTSSAWACCPCSSPPRTPLRISG